MFCVKTNFSVWFLINLKNIKVPHCAKSLLMQNFGGPYFPILEMNTNIYYVVPSARSTP